MPLASAFHPRQLSPIKFVAVDISPVVGGGVHRETRSNGAVGADDDVILPAAVVPFGKMQFAILVLDDA